MGDKSVSAVGGGICSVVTYALQIDWSRWATEMGLEVLKAAIVGAVGAAAGLLVKKAIDRLFFKKHKHHK